MRDWNAPATIVAVRHGPAVVRASRLALGSNRFHPRQRALVSRPS